MLKRIDLDGSEEITGFSYENECGDLEYVDITDGSRTVGITSDVEGISFSVYNEDIPKLILALKAAYEHVMKEKM